MTARLKKTSLNPDDLNSFRPISLRTSLFYQKMTEHVVMKQFIHHCRSERASPSQRVSLPTTSLHRVSSAGRTQRHLIRAIDDGHVAALALLDLSSAFDSVDHSTLLSILRIQVLRHQAATRVVLFIPNWTYTGV